MCVALSIVPEVGQGLCSPSPTTYHYLGELFALPRENSEGRGRKTNPMPLVLISSMIQVSYSYELHHLWAIFCCHGRVLHDLDHFEKLGLRRL